MHKFCQTCYLLFYILFTGGHLFAANGWGGGGGNWPKSNNHTITTTILYIYIYTHRKRYTLFVANLQKKNIQWFPILLTFYCVKCESYMQLVRLQVFLLKLNGYMNSISLFSSFLALIQKVYSVHCNADNVTSSIINIIASNNNSSDII